MKDDKVFHDQCGHNLMIWGEGKLCVNSLLHFFLISVLLTEISEVVGVCTLMHVPMHDQPDGLFSLYVCDI